MPKAVFSPYHMVLTLLYLVRVRARARVRVLNGSKVDVINKCSLLPYVRGLGPILGSGFGLELGFGLGLGENSNVSDPGIELGDGICDIREGTARPTLPKR